MGDADQRPGVSRPGPQRDGEDRQFRLADRVILQTPVVGVADAFVEDMGAFAISLLVGYEKFILERCAIVLPRRRS